MIVSAKGKKMIGSISPIYLQSVVMQDIFQVIGEECDESDRLVEEILLQLFPQTATWGLVFWESRVGLHTNLTEDIEKRRKKVIAKMQTKWPITPERMASILTSYIGAEAIITEGIEEYTFDVMLASDQRFDVNINEVISQIKRIKPSHLDFNLGMQYKEIIGITQECKMYDYNLPIIGGYCGTIPTPTLGAWTVPAVGIGATDSITKIFKDYKICGTINCSGGVFI